MKFFTSSSIAISLKSLVALALLALALRAPAADFVVSNLNDSGAGSLRQAILDANGNGFTVADAIVLMPPAAGGALPVSILSTPLPPITTPTTIRAPIAGSGVTMEVQVPGYEHGLRVESDQVFIRDIGIMGASTDKANIIFSGVSGGGVIGCSINNYAYSFSRILSGDGILLARGGVLGSNYCRDVLIQGNIINGALRAGIYSESFGTFGVVDSTHQGTAVISYNAIRECAEGIVLDSASNDSLQNGLKQVAITGNVIDSNSANGVRLISTAVLMTSNRIGLTVPTEMLVNSLRHRNGGHGIVFNGTAKYCTVRQNVISGNAFSGVLINFSAVEGSLGFNGNHIGVDLAGNTARPNERHGIEIVSFSRLGYGIEIGGSGQTGVGPAVPHNVISGNLQSGIHIAGSNVRGMNVTHNHIGTNLAGTLAVPNQASGIFIGAGVRDVTVGITFGSPTYPQPFSLISGNVGPGIRIDSIGDETPIDNVRIQHCYIGTTADGQLDLGNASGIVARGNVVRLTVEESVIAASLGNGISLTLGTDADVLVARNHIGTNPSLVPVLLGDDIGVEINSGSAVSIYANVIGGNATRGISVLGGSSLFFTLNKIGLLGARNRGHGAVIEGSAVTNFSENTITNNQGDGIVARGASYSTFSNNVCYANSGLGINLQPSGEANNTPTANDGGDGDGGPNALMNKPVISSVVESGGNWIISGTLDSLQSDTFQARVEIFGTTFLNWSGRPHADAEVRLASRMISGPTWSTTVPKRLGIAYISATATLTSATSELSAPVFAPDGFKLEIVNFERNPPLPGGPPTAFNFNLDYTCRPGRTYELQRSRTMAEFSWFAVANRRPDYVGTDRFLPLHEGGKYFFRVVELP